ncbi:MAG: hypothetical protein LBV74_17835 [Tannerella sp.]|jgi:hypothetical protein|nr:hypothetical protein [Tannerella sp.]
MELEQLKEIWTSLDNRMQQQEGLRSALIKEMLLSKSDKALSRLINYGYFGIILGFVSIPIIIWVYTVSLSLGILFRIIASVIVIYLTFHLIAGIFQLIKLHQVNFSNPVKSNIYIVEKLNIFNKRYLMISYVFALLIIFAAVSLTFFSRNIEYWRWGILIALVFAGTIGFFWEYKRIYRRNFNSILKSLDELKDLDESDGLQS